MVSREAVLVIGQPGFVAILFREARGLVAELDVEARDFGHSTLPIERFIALLQTYGIERLADIRTIPRSRHNPQFNDAALASTLAAEHIEYAPMPELGWLRHARKDSPNTGWRNASSVEPARGCLERKYRHTCYSHRSISGAKLSHDQQRAMSREWNRALRLREFAQITRFQKP
jgi:hypothetical protein